MVTLFKKMAGTVDLTTTRFICSKTLADSNVSEARSRAIGTFIESSKKRQDGFDSLLKGRETVTVHEACRKSYNQPRMITAAIKRNYLDKVRHSPDLRSESPGFSAKTSCILCAEKINDEFYAKQRKVPVERRDSVHEVQTFEFKNQLIARALYLDTEESREIIKRIEPIADVVAAEVKYHHSCLKRRYRAPKAAVPQKRGPKFDEVDCNAIHF